MPTIIAEAPRTGPPARLLHVNPPTPAAGDEDRRLNEVFNALRARWSETTALPESLDRIVAAIAKSQRMLEWKDDWDGEGSPAYAMDTWQRAVLFLAQNASRLWRAASIAVVAPKILPGPDGSIDMHWKTGQRNLLINFPANIAEPITFYGDNRLGQSVKGVLDTRANNQWLLMWLMQ